MDHENEPAPLPHRILKNAAFCFICSTLIESKHRHDFVSCKCGNLFVDGGRDYLRRGLSTEIMASPEGDILASWEDRSELQDVVEPE